MISAAPAPQAKEAQVNANSNILKITFVSTFIPFTVQTLAVRKLILGRWQSGVGFSIYFRRRKNANYVACDTSQYIICRHITSDQIQSKHAPIKSECFNIS